LIFEVISLFSDLKLMRFGHIIFGLGKKVWNFDIQGGY
jgi:hypothetical protein